MQNALHLSSSLNIFIFVFLFITKNKNSHSIFFFYGKKIVTLFKTTELYTFKLVVAEVVENIIVRNI